MPVNQGVMSVRFTPESDIKCDVCEVAGTPHMIKFILATKTYE
jgi:hypothetical protein